MTRNHGLLEGQKSLIHVQWCYGLMVIYFCLLPLGGVYDKTKYKMDQMSHIICESMLTQYSVILCHFQETLTLKVKHPME